MNLPIFSARYHSDLPYIEVIPSIRLRWYPAEICDISCTRLPGFWELRFSWATVIGFVRLNLR
jgi:hypothetical protein